MTSHQPETSIYSALESGTPVHEYLGPAAIEASPAPSAASQSSAASSALPTDPALSSTKRAFFALSGAYSGAMIQSYLHGGNSWIDIIGGVLIFLFLWTFSMSIAEARSRRTQWGLVAVVSAYLMSSSIDGAIWRILNFTGTRDFFVRRGEYDIIRNFDLPQSDALQGIALAIVATAFALLAPVAVIKSLRGWRVPIGLLAIILTAVAAISARFGYGLTGFGPTNPDFIGLGNTWGAFLALFAPFLLFIVYIWPQRRRPDNKAQS